MTTLGILISGRGSNMMAIAEACTDGRIPARVGVVVSNTPAAAGLDWARSRGLPTAVLPHRHYSDRAAHDRAVVTCLAEHGVEWVCLAGYMRLLSPAFLEAFPSRVLNIHPSLLPAFPGMHAQRQAWEWGVRLSGCTVHLVDAELDHGPIIAQTAVEIGDCRSAEETADRILKAEHSTYPSALARLLREPWDVQGRRVVFGSSAPNQEWVARESLNPPV